MLEGGSDEVSAGSGRACMVSPYDGSGIPAAIAKCKGGTAAARISIAWLCPMRQQAWFGVVGLCESGSS